MRHITIAAVVLSGFVSLSSVAAQPVTYYPDANWDLPPDGVLAIVRSTGLEPRGHPQRQGATYALRALNPAHQEVQVTVDARSGRILRVEGADDQADKPHAISAPRPNVAPVTKLADAADGSLTAQPVTYYPDANWDLPPDEVLAIVHSNGLEPRSHPQREGAAYALRALDPAHQEVQVTVDARSGRILRIEKGADDQADNPHAGGAPRANVAPAAKLVTDAAGSKSGGSEAARPRPKVVAQTSAPSLLPKNVKVLGDRVRCDVRYQELKLPESEYRAFFKRCMGTPAEAGLKDEAKEEPMTPLALQTAMKELSDATKLALKMQQVTSDTGTR